MAYTYVLDTPSIFAPLAEWRSFLASVDRLPQDDDGVRFAREAADRIIREKEGSD